MSTRTIRKDPFAAERARARAGIPSTYRKDPFAAERARVRGSVPSPRADQLLAAMVEEMRGANGKTPVKGVDYLTPAELAALIEHITERLPKPENGKDAVVDYNLILHYVVQETEKAVAKAVAALPKPENGKDAEIDMAALVNAVLRKMPKLGAKATTIDYLGIKQYIDKQIKAIDKEPRVLNQFTGGGATSIRQLRDVILDGVPQDVKGNYILTPGGADAFTLLAPNEAVDGARTVFTWSSTPKAIINNGSFLLEASTTDESYTRSGNTITMPFAPQVPGQFRAVI